MPWWDHRNYESAGLPALFLFADMLPADLIYLKKGIFNLPIFRYMRKLFNSLISHRQINYQCYAF